MKVDHVAIYVNDLEAEKDFFVKYFNATASSKFQTFRGDFDNYILRFSDDSRLVIMTDSSIDAKKASYRTGIARFAFLCDDRKEVDDIMDKLAADGVIAQIPRINEDGFYEAVVVDPEGNEIVVTEWEEIPF